MKHLLLLLLLSVSFKGYAGLDWRLKKDQDGIKIYTAAVPNSNIKAVKVECIINATLSGLAALLLDAKAHEQWVYSTKQSYLVKQIGPAHQIYYSEIAMPWPLSNRDIVVELMITQPAGSKTLMVKNRAVEGYVTAVKDKVRVLHSEVNWTVTPLSSNSLKIEYVAQADPGGTVPAWMVNMFSTKGPYETFQRLRKAVLLPAYRNASFDFIKE